jgi:flagellar biosynthesis/type III secretory pathway protein FliH
LSRSVLRGAAVAERVLSVPARRPVEPPPVEPEDPRALVEQARGEADALVAQARAEAHAVREEAFAEGYRAGRAEGLTSVAAALAAVEGLADAVSEQRAVMEAEATEQAALLAMEVAAKLVRAELAIAPERVVDVVRGAIRRASDRSALTVLVHPDDLAVCREAAADIVERMGGIGVLEVVDEPRMDPGSCIVRTPNGDVDASFSSQLARVMDALAAPPDHELMDRGPVA